MSWRDTVKPANNEPKKSWRDTIAKAPEADSVLESTLRGAAQGASLGFADELTGGAETAGEVFTDPTLRLKDLLTRYKKNRDLSRENYRKAEADNPKSYLAGNVGGGIATAFVPGLNLAKGATLGKVALQSAGVGAAGGFGSSEREDILGLAKDTAIGGVIGGVAPGAINLAGKALAKGGQYVAKGAKAAGFQALKAFTDTSPEMAKKLLARTPEQIKGARTREEIAEAAVDAVGALKSKVSQGSSEAFDILENESVKIPKKTFIDAIDNEVKKLKRHGSITAEVDRDISRLEDTRRRTLAQKGDLFSGAQTKSYIRQLDNAAQETTSAGGFASDDVQALRNVRREVDGPLKEASPAYREKMSEVAKDVDVLKRADKLFGKDQTVNARLESLNRKNANPFVRSTLQDLDAAGGTKLSEELETGSIRDYFAKDTTNGARKTVMGTAVGAGLGALGGPFGSALGAGIGGMAGAALDKNARPIAEAALRLSQRLDPISGKLGRFAKPLLEAAKRGPAAFVLTHQTLLNTNEEYRKTNETLGGKE